MIKENEKAFWNTAAFLLRTLLTIVVVVILLVQANGYVINFQNLTVTKIGLLYIHPNPADATASLSWGMFEKQGQNLVAQLVPGQYTVTLSRPDYLSWQQTVSIEAGRSTAFPFATLYLAQPSLLEQRTPALDELKSPLVDQKLEVVGEEIWHTKKGQPVLVTRYSRSVRSARLFDAGHVLLQLGSEIHIVDIDGSNDQLLLTLPDTRVRRLIPIDNKTIGILDTDLLTTYRIR